MNPLVTKKERRIQRGFTIFMALAICVLCAVLLGLIGIQIWGMVAYFRDGDLSSLPDWVRVLLILHLFGR